MENLAVITPLYHSGSFRNHLLGFRKKLKCYSPAKVDPYWKKLCPLSCVSKTSGIVFPNTDRPWLVNNTYIYFLIIRGCFDRTHDVTCRV